MTAEAKLAGLLQAFFHVRLIAQKRASSHTIASYRDTFRLLLVFAHERIAKPPAALTLDDLDAPLVGAFLAHVENERGNSARSRNVRLAAIRSFFRYAAFQEPGHAALIQRVLAMPNKRFERRPIAFLNRAEIAALLAAPDRSRWSGRRDHALLTLALQSGMRCSEITGLRRTDVELGVGAHVRCHGKGRKERCTPLRRETVAVLRSWLRESGGDVADPVFPSARGGALSIDGVEYLVRLHVTAAARRCPSLLNKRVSPHVLRHTAAMEMLQAGVDHATIALWLGHESVETTQMYVHADLALKERALSRTKPFGTRAGRYRPDDRLLAFLQSL